MLIAFVLLGRNLEQRAKIKATSDMTSLLSILPSKARLLFNGTAEDLSSTVEVPSDSLSVGDQIVVLPGVSIAYSFWSTFIVSLIFHEAHGILRSDLQIRTSFLWLIIGFTKQSLSYGFVVLTLVVTLLRLHEHIYLNTLPIFFLNI